MHTDESDLEPRANTFFIYGGVTISSEKAKVLSDSFQSIREEFSVPSTYLLKYKPKPPGLDHPRYNECKQRIIQAAIDNECLFLISLIHHRVDRSPDTARRNQINRVAFQYNCLLCRKQSFGLILIDRFSDTQIDAHLREKLSVGLRGMPYSDPYRLERILGYHYSACGQSHFGTVVDIIISSFRFAVNAYCRNERSILPTASALLSLLSPLFFKEEGDTRVNELSLFFSPKIMRTSALRQEYENLKQYLSSNGITAAQEITDLRLY